MSKNEDNRNKLVTALIVAAAVIMVFNGYQLSALSKLKAGSAGSISVQAVKSAAAAPAAVNTANLPDIIPKGVPAVYGQELGVSFDDVSVDNPVLADQIITKLGNLDRQIQLSGADF